MPETPHSHSNFIQWERFGLYMRQSQSAVSSPSGCAAVLFLLKKVSYSYTDVASQIHKGSVTF